MPRMSLEAEVEPRVLAWARESIGVELDVVVKRLGVSRSIVQEWESGARKPTLKQLEKLAHLYRRPLAAFFLPAPPIEPPPPTDFRVAPSGRHAPFSAKTRLILRRARRLQAVAQSMTSDASRRLTHRLESATISEDPEVAADRMRNILGVAPEEQRAWKDEEDAFRGWREAIEARGVLVFQFSMPVEEAKGFSLAGGDVPVIVVNHKDFLRSRIFTLFHECGHLMLGQAGICDIENPARAVPDIRNVEKFCNHIAGAILVPRNMLLAHPFVKGRRAGSPWQDEELNLIAREFKVSTWVVMLRLVALQLASRDFYRQKDEEWRLEMKRVPQRGRSPVPERRCVREHGVPFVTLTLENLHADKITYGDAADYLSLRLKYLPRLEQLVMRNG